MAWALAKQFSTVEPATGPALNQQFSTTESARCPMSTNRFSPSSPAQAPSQTPTTRSRSGPVPRAGTSTSVGVADSGFWRWHRAEWEALVGRLRNRSMKSSTCARDTPVAADDSRVTDGTGHMCRGNQASSQRGPLVFAAAGAIARSGWCSWRSPTSAAEIRHDPSLEREL